MRFLALLPGLVLSFSNSLRPPLRLHNVHKVRNFGHNAPHASFCEDVLKITISSDEIGQEEGHDGWGGWGPNPISQ